MERRFSMNDFEQSLKEHTDEFRMIPSKRVWHGIYNDLHPGRRWPSVTMSFLLIFTLVVIGHLNTHNGRLPTNPTNTIAGSKDLKVYLPSTGLSNSNQKIATKNDEPKNINRSAASSLQTRNTRLSAGETTLKSQKENLITGHVLAANSKPINNSSRLSEEKTNLLPVSIAKSNTNNFEPNDFYDANGQAQNNINPDGTINEIIKEKALIDYFGISPVAKEVFLNVNTKLNVDMFLLNENVDKAIRAEQPADKDNAIAKIHKKRNNKISWIYFADPVVNSVSFRGETLKQGSGMNYSPAVAINQKRNKVLYNSALGLETGLQMNYKLAKKLQLTSGIHLTYSGYKIISNEVHPTFATLLLREPGTGVAYAQSYITHYGDGTGQTIVALHNYSWQASLPVGFQYEFFGNDKIQVKAGADIEPSLVFKSSAYILSSDGNNYVNDPSLLRKWNVSSNFGAFVSFNSSKFKWQIGPNIRYQWLSTYQKVYTVKEHLIDYGIRIGISK
ncbi:MAG: hypothetical protein ABI472_12100 [Ginsengibacter sp.]